ncbi:MAG: outer membrane beta-barrel protein [Steroidobacteraceae bacterium]
MQGRCRSWSQVIAIALLYGATPAAFPDNATSPPSAVGAANPDGPAQGCKPGSENEGLYARLKDSYQEHLAWNGGDPNAPPAMIVGGAEIPESNPPWPYSTWNIGGSETIGVDNMYYSALMDALYCGKGGQKLKDSRFTIYGWIEPGGDVSTSHTRYNFQTGTGGNSPAAYSYEPNTVQLDQVALYIERTPDEVQRDHFDWGGRFTGIYGTDYKYTFSNGIFSNQYLTSEKPYGFDPVMYYLDFWFPQIAEGENVRVGRYISIPDIEAQLAPNNLTYSHSLLYTFDPYTQNGIVSTTKLNKNWQMQTELSAGNDIGPWVKSERQLTPAACVIWTSDSGKDNLYPCMNGLNDGNWRWNNVQHAVITWYHKFDSKWHTDTEFWYMWEAHTPNVNNPAGAAYIPERYSYVNIGAPSGAQCNPAVVFCYSYEWAALNYINYQIGPRDIVVWRTDYMNDATGQRTGFKTRYVELDLGYTHWMGDVIELRPEIRWEHAREAQAYDNPTASPEGGKHSQAMIAADAIIHF